MPKSEAQKFDIHYILKKYAHNLAYDVQAMEIENFDRVIQSSLDHPHAKRFAASPNGLFWSAVSAYRGHHHLVIRPDDVWVTCLAQFSMYINAHAEELRKTFVSHEGRKSLVVEKPANCVNYGKLAYAFTEAIGANLNDPQVVDWILQDFSTTTDTDRIAQAIIMMGTFQKYFAYIIDEICGIPSVTLLGTKADWIKLQQAAEKFAQYGEEPTLWCQQLKVVLSRFVRTFDCPDAVDVKDFWGKMVHFDNRMCGRDDITGWIS